MLTLILAGTLFVLVCMAKYTFNMDTRDFAAVMLFALTVGLSALHFFIGAFL